MIPELQTWKTSDILNKEKWWWCTSILDTRNTRKLVVKVTIKNEHVDIENFGWPSQKLSSKERQRSMACGTAKVIYKMDRIVLAATERGWFCTITRWYLWWCIWAIWVTSYLSSTEKQICKKNPVAREDVWSGYYYVIRLLDKILSYTLDRRSRTIVFVTRFGQRNEHETSF